MWVLIKTYNFTSEENIRNVLINNKIKPIKNMFESIRKNVKFIKKQDKIDMDLIVFESSMVRMKLQKCGSSLFREDCNNNYVVTCNNIINENGEYFSSLIYTLNENDRIVFVNVLLQRSANYVCFNNEKTIITVRPENNPLVFVFKYTIPENMNVKITNLSRLNNSGTHSLFGSVKKIIKYSDKDYMLLRIICNDKSSIKTRKYPHLVEEFMQVSVVEKILGVKWDFSSYKVDVLIKNPCIDFILLAPTQRIFLDNIQVEYVNDIHVYSLHVEGHANNIRVDPVETNSVNSLRPLAIQFPKPNELNPVIQPKKKYTVHNNQLASKDILNQELNEIVTRSKLNLSTKQGQHCETKSTSSSSDENVNLSPCQDFSPSKSIYTNDNNYLVTNDNLNDHDSLFTKKIILNPQTNNQIQKCSNSSPIIPLNKASSSKTKEACLSRENSHNYWSSDGSCSSSFLNIQEVSTPNMKSPSSNQHPNTMKESTQYLGPCRPVYFEPNLFGIEDIVHGHCTKCSEFIPKSLLELSTFERYKCPKCFSVVKLTFYFKIIFLYGKHEEQAIEVCCFNEKAERVIQKLTKKTINVENYLLNYDYKILVADTIKSMLKNKTKVNIVICKSPYDKINFLLTIDV